MEEKINPIESLVERTLEFNRTSLELLKLRTIDKAAQVTSTMVSHLPSIITLTFFIIALNIAVALWIGDLLGKSYYGFMVVAAFYGIIGLIAHVFVKDWLRKRVSNSIIRQVFSQ